MLATVITAAIAGLGALIYDWWSKRQARQNELDLAGMKAHEAGEADRLEAERLAKINAEKAKSEAANSDPTKW